MASFGRPIERLTPARALHLAVATFLAAVGFALLAPTRLDISILLKEVMHGLGVTSLSVGGFISTATLLGDGFTEMFWGRLSDRWSRTGTLVLGIAAFSIFSILTAIATTVPLIYLMRILLGVGQAMYIPAYFAFLGGIYGKRRGLLLGSLGGMFTIGAAINPILTRDMFVATGRWQTPFVIYGLFGLGIAVTIFVVGIVRGRIYETRLGGGLSAPPERHYWLFSRSMVLLLITMMLWGLTQYGFLGIFVTYLREAQHFSLKNAAAVASVAGWSAFAFSFLAGYLSDHIGRRTSLMIFGTVALLTAAPLFVLTQSIGSAMVFAAIFQACNGVFYPVGIAYAQDLAEKEQLGVHTGAVSGLGHLMAGISGYVAGTIAGTLGYAALGWYFTGASVIMVLTIALTVGARPVEEDLTTVAEPVPA